MEWSLQLQDGMIPLMQEPGGAYHAEAHLDVGTDKKFYLRWTADAESGQDWTFAISAAPLDDSGNPGTSKTWKTSGTVPSHKKINLHGFVKIDNMKDAG